MDRIKRFLLPKKGVQVTNCQPSRPLEIQPFTESNVIVPTKHIISIEDITINKELGMGQFGVVQQGTWNTGQQRLQVAIKCLGHERMTSNSTEFLKEAAVMHSIEHPNVVRLYGVVLHLDNLMLVTELAPLRSLLECLREVSLRANFPVPTLCEFAEQICDGMTYLEQKRLIHRDLAARNILVFTKDKVKISDFGLSRALGVGKDYYQTNYNVNLKLPVAWCAPECILYLRFTSASDVWAFGVCLWEMFTYGFQPWAAFSGQQILEAIDAPNCQRLERPECCPSAYYDLMLHCWEHEAVDRPKFKDLNQMLYSIRPEQVQASIDYQQPEDGSRGNLLEYKAGQIITVLNKQYPNTSMWYGVLPGGTCGVFDPNKTKPYYRPEQFEKLRPSVGEGLSAHSSRSSARIGRSPRPVLSRTDIKRHTYQGKRTIQRTMISSPQGDVQHTGHVGLDGAYFGDISFLDPAGCPPKVVVTPYRVSEDMEQVPLLNPNSPSHTTGATCTPPYPISPNGDVKEDCDEVDLASTAMTFKKAYKGSEPSTSRSFITKVKNATLGRSHKHEGAADKIDEVHEYHEISDTDTESIANDSNSNTNLAESSGTAKGYTDFGQSLLDEMETIFRNYDEEKQVTKRAEINSSQRAMTLNKPDKSKHPDTGTMKPMSSHDKKTLETAVALANELTSKSMTDLEADPKVGKSPSEKSKGLLHFKFPTVSRHLHGCPYVDKDLPGKQERRNFTEEARSVRDIQSTLTEESKRAYTSLIEQPTPSSALMSQITQGTHSMCRAAAVLPLGNGVPPPIPPKNKTLRKLYPHKSSSNAVAVNAQASSNVVNVLPLPERSSKTKMVDKTRHVRKHPLKLIKTDVRETKHSSEVLDKAIEVKYENTSEVLTLESAAGPKCMVPKQLKSDTNPFKLESGNTPYMGKNARIFANACAKAAAAGIDVLDMNFDDEDEEPHLMEVFLGRNLYPRQ